MRSTLRSAARADNVRRRKAVIRFCMGSDAHWDLFRTFEAIARLGGITAAARSLSISQSTASRHLAQLEEIAGSPLVFREVPLRLTQRGEAVLAATEPMVSAALAARSALESAHEPRGEVTLTTVGEVVRWVLAPHFASLAKSYPHLRLRVLADNKVNSLAAGEADLAVRLARPTHGDLVARRLYSERYGYFAHKSLELSSAVPWVGLCGSLSMIAEQRHADRVFGDRPARMLLEDVEALALAVQAGVGVAVLPKRLAARFDAVIEVRPEHIGASSSEPIADRDFWLVVHRSKQRVAKVRAVIHWLERAFNLRAPA